MIHKSILFSSLTLLLLTLSALTGHLQAQQETNIIEKLTKDKPGEGTIRIVQDSRIAALIGQRGEGSFIETDGNFQYIRSKGYRLQLYMGNNPKKSKAEAFNMEKAVKAIYPELNTYVTFNAPFWKLKVGDFKSWEEADRLLREFKEQHKSISKEVFIIKDDIRLKL